MGTFISICAIGLGILIIYGIYGPKKFSDEEIYSDPKLAELKRLNERNKYLASKGNLTDAEIREYNENGRKALSTTLYANNYVAGVKCPKCNHCNAGKVDKYNAIGQLLLDNINFTYRCGDCGHKW